MVDDGAATNDKNSRTIRGLALAGLFSTGCSINQGGAWTII